MDFAALEEAAQKFKKPSVKSKDADDFDPKKFFKSPDNKSTRPSKLGVSLGALSKKCHVPKAYSKIAGNVSTSDTSSKRSSALPFVEKSADEEISSLCEASKAGLSMLQRGRTESDSSTSKDTSPLKIGTPKLQQLLNKVSNNSSHIGTSGKTPDPQDGFPPMPEGTNAGRVGMPMHDLSYFSARPSEGGCLLQQYCEQSMTHSKDASNGFTEISTNALSPSLCLEQDLSLVNKLADITRRQREAELDILSVGTTPRSENTSLKDSDDFFAKLIANSCNQYDSEATEQACSAASVPLVDEDSKGAKNEKGVASQRGVGDKFGMKSDSQNLATNIYRGAAGFGSEDIQCCASAGIVTTQSTVKGSASSKGSRTMRAARHGPQRAAPQYGNVSQKLPPSANHDMNSILDARTVSWMVEQGLAARRQAEQQEELLGLKICGGENKRSNARNENRKTETTFTARKGHTEGVTATSTTLNPGNANEKFESRPKATSDSPDGRSAVSPDHRPGGILGLRFASQNTRDELLLRNQINEHLIERLYLQNQWLRQLLGEKRIVRSEQSASESKSFSDTPTSESVLSGFHSLLEALREKLSHAVDGRSSKGEHSGGDTHRQSEISSRQSREDILRKRVQEATDDNRRLHLHLVERETDKNGSPLSLQLQMLREDIQCLEKRLLWWENLNFNLCGKLEALEIEKQRLKKELTARKDIDKAIVEVLEVVNFATQSFVISS